MKTIFTSMAMTGLLITSGCHAHKPDKVVVVKKGTHTQKMVLIDNDHKRRDYRIVHSKPKKTAV